MRPCPRPLSVLVAAALGLAACASVPPAERASTPAQLALPAMKTFGPARPTAPERPNGEIARDFLDLSFRMESGRQLERFTRFEAPVRVGLRGSVPPTAVSDLDRLLTRLRGEAQIDIATARPGEAANLWIEFVPRASLQRAAPQAACFVVPRNESLSEFRRGTRGRPEWASLSVREAATVFIPSDVAPQEIRDCLNEEVAQALGPLNDLFRLPDSIFNDDNFHGVLTGFDMLILRTTYAPDLASGMTEAEVTARLPGLLARFNPRGARPSTGSLAVENRTWTRTVEEAMTPRSGPGARRSAASRALSIARAEGWTDARLAFSFFSLARTAMASEVETALAAYLEAAALYDGATSTGIQSAHVGMQLAAFSLSAGRHDAAISIVDRHTPAALRAENAALLASLLMIKAEALDGLGRRAESQTVRLDSLGWARYGFGTESEVRRRMAEIGALRPRRTPEEGT